MWFRQIQLYELKEPIKFNAKELSTKLEQLEYHPCLPNLPASIGWISPTEDISPTTRETNEDGEEILSNNSSFVHACNDFLLICLQTEEKILPATVIRNKVKEQIKHIEQTQYRKVSGKEKQILSEDVYHALIPQAFGKVSKTYAYIDTKNNWLAINTTNKKKTDEFVDFLKKTIEDLELAKPELKKISTIMTTWLKENKYPSNLTIENSCVLQDPNNQARIIRYQQQDLFAPSIQSLLKEGCEISQMQFSLNDLVTFNLKDDFTFRGLKYLDSVIETSNETESETKLERFTADFVIMTGVLTPLIYDMKKQFCKTR